MWRFLENANGNTKEENIKILDERLFAIKKKVAGCLKVEVGTNFTNDNDASDVVLYSEFDSKESLNEYQIHPDHIALKEWLSTVRSEKRAVDYRDEPLEN